MVLNGVLFIAVIAITVLFLYLAYTFKRDAERKRTYTGTYHIEVSTDFAGQSLSIYMNDSLLMKGIMPDTLTQTSIDKFADENILMIVDNATDNTTPFNLNPDGSRVTVKKTAGIISIIEREQ